MTISLGTAGALHLTSVVFLLVGTLLIWLPRWRHTGLTSLVFGAGAAALAAEGVLRAMITRRAPVVGTYENTLVVAAMIAVACLLVLQFAAPAVRLTLARLTAPWALMALFFGSRFSASPLLIGLEGRGALAYVHAFVGWFDFTVLIVGTMAAIGMLMADEGNLSVWRATTTRMLGAGFTLLTATIVSGALLSFGVFGSWYQWQIVETLSAVLWLAYGFALHAFLLFGWRGKRLAVLVVATLPIAIGAFWSWSLYSGTYHFFERVLGS